jgi:hypothetical protein
VCGGFGRHCVSLKLVEILIDPVDADATTRFQTGGLDKTH